MGARADALAEFVKGLTPEELALIKKFMQLRSDFLDAGRGLPPWPKK